MIDRFRLASTFAQSLKDHKVPPAEVLRNAGLPSGLFQQEKIQVDTSQLFAMWRAVGEVSRDPAIGLKLSAEYRLERFQPTSIAAVCSRTFGDAVQRMGRYKQLVAPEEINLRPQGKETAVEFVFTHATETEPDVLVDNCLSWILTIGQRGTDGRIAPVHVELTRGTKDRALLEEYYGCRVKFNAERNAIVFRTTDLNMPFTTHNAELLAMVSGQLDAEVAERKTSSDVGTRVRHALKRSLAGKRPTLQDVASEVGMSTRSLQRKLSDAGVTFQHVVEETRRELARHYLSQSAVELNETAFLLGYEDASSFFRAFNSWEGVTPGEWRTKHSTAHA
jgi:AraC-like DNA-binding protein